MGFFVNEKCRSTARLDGKVAIVTGSNTGIGKVTAAELAKRGAEVIMACRNLEKADRAAADIKNINPDAKLVTMKLNLSSFTSVRDFCYEFKSKYDSLHLLINNAGVMMCPRSLTEDGYELQFATNHLGHFLLTLLLLPVIIKSAPARIVNVSSKVHSLCKDVIVVSLHPGVVDTDLSRHLGSVVFPGASWFYSKFSKSPEQGAQTTLHCALDESIKTGHYYDDCAEKRTSGSAANEELAKQLWDKSIEFCKLEDCDTLSSN